MVKAVSCVALLILSSLLALPATIHTEIITDVVNKTEIEVSLKFHAGNVVTQSLVKQHFSFITIQFFTTELLKPILSKKLGLC